MGARGPSTSRSPSTSRCGACSTASSPPKSPADSANPARPGTTPTRDHREHADGRSRHGHGVRLDELTNLGVELAIDDFGTGYSSLAYLSQLQVSELKIDRSFVMGMRTNRDDALIVRSTIDLGHNLGLRLVAEGVEDPVTLDLLRQQGCDGAQGLPPRPPRTGRADPSRRHDRVATARDRHPPSCPAQTGPLMLLVILAHRLRRHRAALPAAS